MKILVRTAAMSTPTRLIRRLGDFLDRLRGDQRGAIAVQFALMAIPLAVMVFALVDLGRISLQRRQMQDALDAATLMAARSTATTDADLDKVGDAAFVAEIAGLNLGLTGSDSTFKAGADNHILGSVSTTLKPVIANLWTNKDFTVNATADVVRSSKDLEVAVVLDITGSMDGSRITDLKTGASDLVDIIVKDVQTPFYSKVAIVPYSNSVNVDTYADAVRGAVPVRTITGAVWAAGSARTISAISKANLAEVTTSAAHGLMAGDPIYINGVKGMTDISNGVYTVAAVTSTTKFTLSGVNSKNYSNYTANSATVTECVASTCDVVLTTSGAHGFTSGDLIAYAGMQGMTQLNGATRPIIQLTSTTFDSGYLGFGTSTYSSGGTATCDTSSNPGCANYAFTNASGGSRTLPLSNCVSERIGDEAYTDAAPSSALVGRAYLATGNPCPSATIMPLSTDRTALKSKINSLTIGGSTAGQIGLAWGWYMVSPNFSYLWPNAVQKPAAYKTKDLMKVVVLMTDGAFNTPYCNGVIAKNAGSGSGSNSDHINCNASNGDPFAQARALCKEMKDAKYDLRVYTVGFDVDDSNAISMLKYCASKDEYSFFPATGSELKTAFKSIAQEISALRIAK
ncbi:TadE/TadG family type IV pilus assembly protein [Caulobacter sp. RHG1]|uniref:TadE/TadG family type IV pilus assembly protein n=1 Tax=Caulobacter sp. (strain RHG1) TaxID=2545762 RepID=UPI001F50E670|nr:TadE/TadG family type IV pilus assembly protein [Caulobacter sp. RHG1]NQE62002.1 Flp pilus assembly protein TadG [Caulobacter sp. RHG1]